MRLPQTVAAMCGKVFLALLACCLLVACEEEQGVANNLLSNGSFEKHSYVGEESSAYLTQLPGWTLTDRFAELQFDGFEGMQAADGHVWIELDADKNTGIYTDLDTFAGQSYSISFQYSPRVKRPDTDTNNLEVWWDGQLIATLEGSQVGWTRHRFVVESRQSTTRLAFKATGQSDRKGGWLDDVAVQPVSQLLENGSFESHPALSHANWGFFNTIPGWLAHSGEIEIKTGTHGGLPAVDGEALLEVDSSGNSNIGTTVNTEPGANYTLELAYAPRLPGRKTNSVEVWWGEQRVALLDADQPGWTETTVNLTADADSTALRFVATGRSDGYGGMLDHLRLFCHRCEAGFHDADGDGAGDEIDAYPDDADRWEADDADPDENANESEGEEESESGESDFGAGDKTEESEETEAESNLDSSENLIKNGSFDQHPAVNSRGYGYFSEIPGWQSGGAPFEIQTGFFGRIRASDGDSRLELDAAVNTAASTIVETIHGQTYALSFDYWPRSIYRKTGTNKIEVWWAGEKIATVDSNRPGWQRQAFLVEGLRDTTTLTFKAAGRQDHVGGLIDDVRLVPVSNALENGSFEDHPPLSHKLWGFFDTIPGWTAAQGQLEIKHGDHGGITAIDGRAKLEVDSHKNSTALTYSPTTRGEEYLISFYYSPRLAGNPGQTNSAQVWWGNRLIARLKGRTPGWQHYQFLVRGTGRDVSLRLRATGRSDGYGAMFDDVYVSCIRCTDTFVDADGDGAGDAVDAFPLDPSEWYDTDSDGVGDNADADDDGDGLSDESELALALDPLLADTDGDGVSDAQEDADSDGLSNLTELSSGLNPMDPADATADSDGDGLSNLSEVSQHGTDPFAADSDGDGLADGAEVALGLDPLAVDSDSNGVADGDEDSDADGISNALELAAGLDPNDPADAAVDSDGDGLSNHDEITLHGTDHQNTDSDGDGLSDGVEIANVLNPLANDSNQDGIADGQEDPDQDGLNNLGEVAAGSDLNKADSDADGLPDGLEVALGLDPVATDSDADGVSDADEDHDGDGLSNGIEIANGLDPDNVLDAAQDADQDGLSNSEELLDYNTDPFAADTDGDGLDDKLEIELGLDPAAADSDGDGLADADEDTDGDGVSNADELLAGLALDNPDTDGDGLEDGLELALGTNPAAIDSDSDGVTDLEEDSDNDGLGNGLELEHGLNPSDASDAAQDTDQDGLSNLDELTVHHSDPNQTDTDQDGLADGVEVALGLDPTRSDTDANGVADALEDADGDGVINLDEIKAGTAPDNPDSDQDGLNDGLELALGLNPLTVDSDADGVPDALEDSDGDGLGNQLELDYGLDPADASDALADNDDDGLSNADELLHHHTDPNNADSDGDGLPDAVEIALGLNPAESDSDGNGVGDAGEDNDGDGLSNLTELESGTAPDRADSDGDGLNDGLEHALGLDALSADTDGDGVVDAEEDSDGDGIANAAELNAGLDPADPADASGDADGDGLSNADELLLHHTDPNSADSDSDGLPDNVELALGMDPNGSDSDGDGVSDGAEDSDGDGLSNLQELSLGTDPQSADSDSDGLADAIEIALGLDPLAADSDNNGIADVDEDSDGDGLANLLELEHGLDPNNADDALADSDGDGLSNLAELADYSTDPNKADTDNDGLPDGVELALGLDPLATDSDGNGRSDAEEDHDGDGLSNGEEIAAQTDPSKADTDEDGLDDGLEVSLGLDPLAVDSDNDGISDADEDSDDDGLSNALELAHSLNPADPADAQTDNDQDGLSNAQELLEYSTDPNQPDSDTDGLPDGLEIGMGLNPLGSDSDGDGIADGDEDADEDGLSNALELAEGTDPGNSDSDEDGLSDGVERSLGLNPLAADSDNDGTADWDEDSDADGLSNGLELANQLDPADASDASADNDNDGLSNSEEILQYNTDPDKADSDGDNLTDAQEVSLGIDPNNADTDLDGYTDDVDAYPSDGTRMVLPAPAGLQAGAQGDAVALTWPTYVDQDNLAAMVLERRIGIDGEAEVLLTETSGQTSYTDSTISNGQGYQYRLTAVDARGNSGEPGEWVSVMVATNDATVTALTAERTDQQVSLSWSSDTSQFRVYRNTGGNSWSVLADTTTAGYADTAVEVHGAYQYRVATLLHFSDPFSGAQISVEGPPSEPVSVEPFVVYEMQLSLADADLVTEGVYRRVVEGASDLSIRGSYSDALGTVRITASNGSASHTTDANNGEFYLTLDAEELGTWVITAQDLAPTQGQNNASLTLYLTKDTTPPSVALAAGLASATAADSLVLKGSATDADASIAEVYASSDRFSSASFQGELAGEDFTISVPLLHGPNVFTVTALDAAGNLGSATHTVTRTVGLAPVLTLLTPDEGAQTTSGTTTVAGKIYTDQAATDLRVTVQDQLVDVTGSGGDQGYQFRLDDLLLSYGSNLITVEVTSPGGSTSAQRLITRVDPNATTETGEPLALTITAPLTGSASASANVVVAGTVSGGVLPYSLQINAQAVPVGTDSYGDAGFRTAIELANCDGQAQSALVVLSDATGATTSETLSLYCDADAPVITLSAPSGLAAGTSYDARENPLPISGEVVDANLAGLSLNGNSLVLAPTGVDNTYRFDAKLQLQGGETELVLEAWDKANNLQSQSYTLNYDEQVSITFLSPSEGATLSASDAEQELSIIATVSGLAADDVVTAILNDGDAMQMSVTGTSARLTTTALLTDGEHRLSVEVHDSAGELKARSSIQFDAEPEVPAELALERSEPAANSVDNAPNEPLMLYFNKPVNAADLVISVSQSVHGPEYDLSNQAGAGFTEIPQPEVVELNIDQQPVVGGLAPFDNQQVVGFYPEQTLYFGATVYVEVSYQGETLRRFSYQTQALPTVIGGALVDIFHQPVASVIVSLPKLGLTSKTDASGNFSFGGGNELKTPIPSGRYAMIVNPGQENPAWGTTDHWITVQQGRINRVAPIKLPLIASTEPFVPLKGGAVHSLSGGAISLDLSGATLKFANARTRGNVQTQMLLAGDLAHRFTPAAVPFFAWHLQAGAEGLPGIGVQGDVNLTINIPPYMGSYNHAPPQGARVVILGLESRSLQIVPVGVGKVENRQIVNTTDLAFERLDYISYAAVHPSVYMNLLDYESGELASLAELRAKLEEETP